MPPSALESELAWQIRVAKLPEPEREFRFAVTRRWRFDFAWPAKRVAVECEGGIWSRGRHVRPKGYEADLEKHNAAMLGGWLLLRFSREMITSGEALRMIEEGLSKRRN